MINQPPPLPQPTSLFFIRFFLKGWHTSYRTDTQQIQAKRIPAGQHPKTRWGVILGDHQAGGQVWAVRTERGLGCWKEGALLGGRKGSELESWVSNWAGLHRERSRQLPSFSGQQSVQAPEGCGQAGRWCFCPCGEGQRRCN